MKLPWIAAIGGVVTLAGIGAVERCSQDDGTGPGRSQIVIENVTGEPTTVHVAFGADSAIKDWPFCGGVPPACTFTLKAYGRRSLPLKGAYLNATISFDAPVGCGVTKAEINTNNPKWYSTIDVSLVDGYSNRIAIVVQPHTGGIDAAVLGPPVDSVDGNEWVFGLFPYGCDICVDRQNPPCDIPKGNKGCKTGTQYKPHVPCQYQGLVMGGDESIRIQLVASK